MTDLVFVRTATPVQGGPIDLVFGASSGPAIPTVQVEGGGQISGLRGLAMVRTVVRASGGGQISGIRGTAQVHWDANVSRSTRVELSTTWEDAGRVSSALATHWQDAVPMRVATETRWQDASKLRAALGAHWQEAERLRAAVGMRWQEAQGLRAALGARWEDGERLRAAVSVRWQDGAHLRGALASAWQDTLRLRAAVRSYWQEAVALRATAGGGFGDAVAVRVGLETLWQEAMRPQAGISEVVIPVKPGCYKPGPPVDLVFGADRVVGLPVDLVFKCFGNVLPPAGVVVLPRRSYIMINSVEIRRADALAGDPLPSETFSMQLDRQAWTWNFSASFHAAAGDAVAPGLNGEPVELEVRVNGVPYRMLGETFGHSRRLPERLVKVSGRGKAALLDDKNNPVRTFTSAVDRTASQLMTEALTINGVGFGWSVDFGIEDWLVTGGAWMHQGTYISALAEIAGAAGGYLQPHNTDAVIRVLPAWPKPWWEWGQLVPDIELPAGLSEIDDTDIVDRPLYNRIFVGGESYGVTADLTRTGTSGDLLKQPMVVHPLITGLDVAKQRARAELSVSGRSLVHKMTLPVLGQTGVIKPGVVLRYHDHANALRTGIVRSTNVSMQFPVLTQSLEVESHA